MKNLIPLESVNAISLYTDPKAMQLLLDEIEKQAKDFTPDITTAGGRKEIASQAYKVSRSKTVIDAALKAETDEWARKKKTVDAGRRLAREFCDRVRDEILEPLDVYKAEQERIAEEAAKKAEMKADELAAYAENDLFDREAKMKAFELQQAAEEAERQRLEQERIATEAETKRVEQIKIDAEAKAKQDAADELQAAKDKTARLEQERLDALEREKDRIKQAEIDKQTAIDQEKQRAKDEAERVERERLRLIAENEREAQARAADTENRRKVNRAIVDALVAGGVPQKAAKTVVTLVASGKTPSMSIRY